MQNITVLGSTGSIGVSTLSVISLHLDKYRAFALTANTQVEKLHEQCVALDPVYAVLKNEKDAESLQARLKKEGCSTEVLSGPEALCFVAGHEQTDSVMAAIVGAAGLPPTMAAVHAGKKILLANKESLVMTGQLFMDAVESSGSALLPIDSEHNAIFQCMPASFKGGHDKTLDKTIRKILLTGSGGPFRTLPLEQLADVTPEQACKHPNWSMGQKISVDSATMMNKGLELIEACWLFDAKPCDVQIVVHPQSIIHSMVQYNDGSTLAQLGNPDMRTPIAYGLAWPDRIEAGVNDLDFFSIPSLDFQEPDEQRFPALRLAREAFETGKTAATVLNAANEIAVEAFLNKKIGFTDINRINDKVLNSTDLIEPDGLESVLQADNDARERANRLI